MIKHNKQWPTLLSSFMLCHAFSFPQILLIQHSAQDIWYRLTSTSEAHNSQLRIITSFGICQSPTGKMSLPYPPVVYVRLQECNTTVALDVGPNIVYLYPQWHLFLTAESQALLVWYETGKTCRGFIETKSRTNQTLQMNNAHCPKSICCHGLRIRYKNATKTSQILSNTHQIASNAARFQASNPGS